MKNLFYKYKEIIIYIIFGVLTTLVSWGSYAVLVNSFFLSVELANIISWICSVAFAYVTNKIWVFQSKSWKLKTIIKEGTAFVSSRVLTGVIEILGVPLLVRTGFDDMFLKLMRDYDITIKYFNTEGIYSKIAFAAIIIVLNYVFSKIVVFRTKKEDEK
ncbi:MAG: GtrA family protein [Eubacterium sp.]|nr:GtrA family protein [Eubacterium sp.]